MMLGYLISAGSSILGGILGSNSQEDAINAQIKAQKQFAQHGIRWRVEDANKAGIHPLFALGANTHSFSPIGVPGDSLGAGVSAAGQEIGRAIEARGTSVERAFNAKMMELQLQRGELENQLLASNIARVNSPTQMPPPTPMGAADRWLIDGQAQSTPMPVPERFGGPLPSALVTDVPLERTVSDPGRKSNEPGAVTDIGFARTATGGYAPIPSADVKQRIEDAFIPEMTWALRNVVAPNWSSRGFNPPYPAPPHYEWTWSVSEQAYHLRPRGLASDIPYTK